MVKHINKPELLPGTVSPQFNARSLRDNASVMLSWTKLNSLA